MQDSGYYNTGENANRSSVVNKQVVQFHVRAGTSSEVFSRCQLGDTKNAVSHLREPQARQTHGFKLTTENGNHTT